MPNISVSSLRIQLAEHFAELVGGLLELAADERAEHHWDFGLDGCGNVGRRRFNFGESDGNVDGNHARVGQKAHCLGRGALNDAELHFANAGRGERQRFIVGEINGSELFAQVGGNRVEALANLRQIAELVLNLRARTLNAVGFAGVLAHLGAGFSVWRESKPRGPCATP